MLAGGRFSPRWWRASLIGDSSLKMNYTQPPLNPARRKYPAIVWAAVLFLTATTKLLAADVTLSLSGSPIAEAGGVGTVTATLSAPSALTVTVNLAFSGSATLTSDYTRWHVHRHPPGRQQRHCDADGGAG